MQKLKLNALAIFVTLFLLSCGDDDTTDPTTTTLFEDLGGTDAISEVVNKTIDRIAVDTGPGGLAPYFEQVLELDTDGSGLSTLKSRLVNFLSVATGATDVSYDGESMKDAHSEATNSRMNGIVTDADFDRFVGLIGSAAADADISAENIARIADVLETTRTDIVSNLFENLGGTNAISAVVDETIVLLSADTGPGGLAPFFEHILVLDQDETALNSLKSNLVNFLSAATGSSSASYDARNMRDAHREATNPRMVGIVSHADFERFVWIVGTAAFNVGVSDKNVSRVAGVLETTRADIVSSLFENLGGTTAIMEVVDQAMVLIAADIGSDGIADNFELILSEDVNAQAALKSKIVDFLSVATGSTSASYNGLDMAAAHHPDATRMNGTTISSEDFTRFVGFIGTAASASGVSDKNISRIATVLETYRQDIVSN